MRQLIFEGTRCIAGLAGLLAVDLFAELYVFEWLQWNGTDKNDWFFMLWWVAVLLWTLYCAQRGWRLIRGYPAKPEAVVGAPESADD